MRQAGRRLATMAALAAACGLCACGDDAAVPANAAAGFVPPATEPPVPLPGQAQTTPLTAYVGHYPREAIDGVAFFDRSQVAGAIDRSLTDAALRREIVHAEGPSTPIFQVGDRVASWGCEAENCDNRNWTVLVDADGQGDVCFHDAAAMGNRSRWYSVGGAEMRADGCPSGEGERRMGRID